MGRLAMGKKKEQSLEQSLAGKNPKAVIALTRRHNVKEAKKAAEAKAKEDASWADDVPKKKHELKKESKGADAEDKARRKEDLRRLKAEDDLALSGMKKRGSKSSKGKGGGGAGAGGAGGKVTAFQISERKVAEAKLLDDEVASRKMSAMNITTAAEYAGMLDQNGEGNANHAVDEVSASGIDGALEVMVGNSVKVEAMAMIQKETSGEDLGLRVEALAAKGEMTWKLYQSWRMPEIKGEKPGLK